AGPPVPGGRGPRGGADGDRCARGRGRSCPRLRSADRSADPHRWLRDGRAVRLLASRAADPGRDQWQERHRGHPARRPGPGGPGRGRQRLRARRAEVLPASLVITVGSVSRSRRFSAQLADAVLSLHVGAPTDPTVQMWRGIEPPGDKLAAGLTEVGEVATWLARPQQLDEEGRLFSPGVREGVRDGSEFHRTEYFGPVLGIMHARTLAEAVRMQNGTDYGLTAGLHSLDEDEIAWWTQHVEAGNLYVNRGITGAIVQRQPFGGWKRSSIGQTSKAG